MTSWKLLVFSFSFWLLFVCVNSNEDNQKLEKVLCQLNSTDVGINLPLFSNTTYLVHPGNFCVVENVQHVNIYGDSTSSPSLIKCLPQNDSLSSRGFGFINITNLTIKNVIFKDCGEVVPMHILDFAGSAFSILYIQMPSVLFCSHCFNATLQNVAVTNYFGYALVVINLLGVSVLEGLSITFNRKVNLSSPLCFDTTLENTCKGSGVLIEFADSEMAEDTSSLTISNSKFTDNEALANFSGSCADVVFYKSNILRDVLPDAGALTVVFEQTFKAKVSIAHSTFVNNRGICYGSTTAFYLSHPAQSELSFHDCTFVDNGPSYLEVSNQNFFGSAITIFMLFLKDIGSSRFLNCFNIEDTHFSTQNFNSIPYLSISQLPSNKGSCTATLSNITSESDSYFLHAESVGDTSILQVVMTDLQLTGFYPNNSRTSSSHGIIELINLKQAYLRGTSLSSCSFEKLFGPVVSSIKTYLYLHGNISFQNNHGPKWVEGAAIQMVESFLILIEPALVVFEKNTAVYGGAIYSSGAEKLSPFCSIQYGTKNIYTAKNISKINIHLILRQNSAVLGGNSLYVDNLYNCSVQISETILIDPDDINSIYNALFIAENPVKNGLQEISSVGYRVCICLSTSNNSTIFDCKGENFSDDPIHTYPGKTLDFSLIAVDKGGKPVYSTVFLFAKELKPNNEISWKLADGQEVVQMNKHSCKTVYLNILTEGNTLNVTGQLSAYVQDSDMSLDIPIFLQDCPWGFDKLPYNDACTCSNLLRNFQITCNIDKGTVSVPKFSWTGVVTDGNENNVLVGYSVRCPLAYCKTLTNNITLQPHSSMCAAHREGILCGKCSEPYSSVVGSKKCQKCLHWYLFTIPLYALLGVLLVFLLFALKLTVTAGTMNGLIFYANILYLSKQRFLGTPELSWLQIFIATINLRLGFPLCLYDGMSAIVSSHLLFVFPLYLWLISGSLVLVSRYSSRAANILGGSALHVLATLIHLSYNILLSSVVDGLKYIDVHLENTDGAIFTRRVWYIDGNLTYLTGAHLSLFVFTITTLVLFLLPYTTLLTGIKVFSRFRTVNRFMPLIDAFCAPYKDKWRFWFGARLWVLVVLYTGSALLSERTYGLYFMKVVVLVLFLFAQMAVMPYKSLLINLLDSFFMMNSLVLSAVTLYVRGDLQQLRQGTGALVGMAFIVFLCILGYHVYNILKTRGLCCRCEAQKRNSEEQYSRIPDQPSETDPSEMVDSSKPVTFQVLSYHPEKLRESIIGSRGSVNDL